MINVLIVEDELITAREIERELSDYGLNVVGIASSSNDAKSILQTKEVDVALLDVKLKGLESGIDLSRELKSQNICPFIYVSSYFDKEIRKDILASGPSGYIVKPIDYRSLITTIELSQINFNSKSERVVIKDGKKSYFINPSDVLYIVSDHIYVKIHLKGDVLHIRATLKKLLSVFPLGGLFQINRSVLINPENIYALSGNIVTIGNKEFKISENYQKSVQRALSLL